ncbi:MAG TPA: GNAT family N-acetyltransferase [Candidatus Baltobacteraceae bacterium]|jgi:hypothetical protein|nr:GNAT family N-acetyltransferase [Candidatus Baltobacteraceae bacterium]
MRCAAQTGDQREIEGKGAPTVIIDPLQRPDWDAQVEAHAGSTIFHGTGWARVLNETYGHVPMYVCRFDGKLLAEALPLMEVASRWTGRRGVSLPFTDLCAPLCPQGGDARNLYREAMDCGRRRRWKYLECRNFDVAWEGCAPSLEFYVHVIDLGIGADGLFERLDGAVRRGVRKAEAAGLKVEFSGDRESVRTFYKLHCRTRRRHGLPPQPFRFFESIQRHILGMGRGFVATARMGNQPAAAGVFFYHGGEALYKFGASDFALQQHRPNNLMMWAAARRCAQEGLSRLNLGRTSLSNEGLRRFKRGLGAAEKKLKYAKYDFLSKQFIVDVDQTKGWFNRVFSRMPLPVLRLAGAALYPHLS